MTLITSSHISFFFYYSNIYYFNINYVFLQIYLWLFIPQFFVGLYLYTKVYN